jgi:HSP20 family protein
MSLIPRNSLFDLDRFFDNPWLPLHSDNPKLTTFAPKVDVKDQGDSYRISAELPGVKKEDVHVLLEGGVLTLEAESKQENTEEKDGKIIRQERRYGKFIRSFDLGPNVHESDINARFEDGVLMLTVPKAPKEATTLKRITVT